MIVDAGVRAELLFQRLDGYEELAEADEDEVEEDVPGQEAEPATTTGVIAEESAGETDAQNDDRDEVPTVVDVPAIEIDEPANTDENKNYLSSKLTFTSNRLLDDQANAVMMEWERDIMAKTVDNLFPDPPPPDDEVFVILNIGHGMGIIDELIQTHPRRPKKLEHHIIEVCLRARQSFLVLLSSEPLSLALAHAPARFLH